MEGALVPIAEVLGRTKWGNTYNARGLTRKYLVHGCIGINLTSPQVHRAPALSPESACLACKKAFSAQPLRRRPTPLPTPFTGHPSPRTLPSPHQHAAHQGLPWTLFPQPSLLRSQALPPSPPPPPSCSGGSEDGPNAEVYSSGHCLQDHCVSLLLGKSAFLVFHDFCPLFFIHFQYSSYKVNKVDMSSPAACLQFSEGMVPRTQCIKCPVLSLSFTWSFHLVLPLGSCAWASWLTCASVSSCGNGTRIASTCGLTCSLSYALSAVPRLPHCVKSPELHNSK